MGARRPLHALVVEDDLDDADLLAMEIRRGYDAVVERVESLAQLAEMLATGRWEIVISDFTLNGFTALDALEVVKRTGRDIPFIIVSGSIGEETAVEAMRAGANDFFLKDRLNRLAPAIEREVREAANRQERRQALAQVAENESRLRAIFNQSLVGIAQTDLAHRFVLVNDQFCRITGRTRDELIGSPMPEITHPDHRDEASQLFAKAVTERGGYAIEMRYVRPDGSHVWVNLNVSIVVDMQGESSFGVNIVEDITQRRRADEDLRLAVTARDEFLAMASHELKTPVASLELVLASSLHVLGTVPPSSAPIGKLSQRLGVAAKQVDRLTSLIHNLLDVTRITSGRLNLTCSEGDFSDVVRTAVARLQDLVVRSGSQIVLHAEEPVFGWFDPHAVDVVISNLLANAAKYGMGKPIEVAVTRREDVAFLSVTDHGMGIDLIDQRRIFERFERAVSPNHYGGFGIGLWIARNIAEAHGGAIRVESGPGVGSTFVVEIPLVKTEVAA
jgi:PAS domain S-box-containing protein